MEDNVVQSSLQARTEKEADDLSLLPKHLLDKLLTSSKSQTLSHSLETLIEASRTTEGRHTLFLPTTDNVHILSPLLHLINSLSLHNQQQKHYLSLTLRLLRNLCAGERVNQDDFLSLGGVEAVSGVIFRSLKADGGGDCFIAWFGLKALANVCLAGVEQQRCVWRRLFPEGFVEIARVRSNETCDPLCMILYTCCDGIGGSVVDDLCGDSGLVVVWEIVRTASLGNMILLLFFLVF